MGSPAYTSSSDLENITWVGLATTCTCIVHVYVGLRIVYNMIHNYNTVYPPLRDHSNERPSAF